MALARYHGLFGPVDGPLSPLSFFQPPKRQTPEYNMMDLDFVETENAYEITMDLPGMKKDDINVNVNNGILTVLAERTSSRTDDNNYYERRYGKYSRSIKLPRNANEGDVKASYEDGVLKLGFEKIQKVPGQRIDIA